MQMMLLQGVSLPAEELVPISFVHPFGYNVNATKSWVVVKEESLQSAQHVFAWTGVRITSVGRPYLGAALGSTTFINDLTQQCVSKWIAGYHVCNHLLTLSIVLLILHSLTDMFLSGTIISAPIQVSQPCLLHSNQLCVIIYFLSWFPMLLVTQNVSCSLFRWSWDL